VVLLVKNWFLFLVENNLLWSQMSVWQRSAIVVLFGMTLYTMVSFALKARLMFRARVSSRRYAPILSAELRHQHIDEGIKTSRKFVKEGSHLAGLVLRALEEVARCRQNGTPDSITLVIAREVMEQDTATRVHDWKKGLGLVDAIGRTSPFVGAAAGTQVAFSFGTLLAIAALWFATYFRARTETIEAELKNAASEVRAFLSRQGNCSVCGKGPVVLHMETSFTCAECCLVCDSNTKDKSHRT
jgi:biopolymer transport protein ExbB/TolQ